MDGPAASFRLDDELWASIVYDFALGYRLRVLARDIPASLVPLYLGWLASFIVEVRDRGEDGSNSASNGCVRPSRRRSHI